MNAVLTRPAHHLRPFASALADQLDVPLEDVLGALVELVVSGLVELYVSPVGIMVRANPLTPEESDGTQTAGRRLSEDPH